MLLYVGIHKERYLNPVQMQFTAFWSSRKKKSEVSVCKNKTHKYKQERKST